MKDWTKLTAKERIDMIFASNIEQKGRIPQQVKVSKKLIADLFFEGPISLNNESHIIETYNGGIKYKTGRIVQEFYYEGIELAPIN